MCQIWRDRPLLSRVDFQKKKKKREISWKIGKNIDKFRYFDDIFEKSPKYISHPTFGPWP